MSFIARLFGRGPKPLPPPFDFATNRFHARSTWPPDFSSMSHKESFRLERKFRRRSKLKWARPLWNKSLILIQWGMISTLLAYATLYMDWSGGALPAEEAEKALPDVVRELRQKWRQLISEDFLLKEPNQSRNEQLDIMQKKFSEEQDRIKRARER